MRLQDALALMSPEEREALRSRRRIVLDPRKRIDEIEQTARALVAETDLRQSRFPADARALLVRLAAANGTLHNAANDPGAAMLCELGIAYQSRSERGKPARTGKRLAAGALVLPSAFLVQVPASDSDDPRSLRVCLGFVESDVVPALVSTVVGKPLAVTGPLALQEVWEGLSIPDEIARRVAELPSAEARLLDAIERSGSEVTTEELLALDQSPGLYRTAAGIAVPKRGAPFMLQRRGFLYQIGVDRFVLPTEVSRVVGAARQAERAERRKQILATLQTDDFAPRRARYAKDPSLAAAATLACLRHWDVPLRDEVGAPRGPIRRIAERLGEREETIALFIALLRAAGLARLLSHDAAPGSLAELSALDLGNVLRTTYRRGGAWDETRVEAEVSRGGFSERGTTAAPALRMILLDALEELARDRWVPVEVVVRYALEDRRAAGAAKIHERARRERPGVHRDTIEQALRVMLTESIPAIGMADLGEDGATVRLATRESAGSRPGTVGLVVRSTIELPGSIALHRLLALAEFADPDHLRPETALIVFNIGSAAVVRARARSLDRATLTARFEAVGIKQPFPAAVEELLTGLGRQRELAAFAVSAALVAEDPGLRAELLADPSIRRCLLEVDAGPLLLVRPDVELARLQPRLTRMGVRVVTIEPQSATAESMPAEPSQPVSAPPPRLEIQRRRTVPPDDVEGGGKASLGS